MHLPTKPNLRASAVASAIIFSIIFAAWSMPARAADVFEVQNILVDVKAATAEQARKSALVEAERRAFYTMIARLTLPEDRERIPELSNQEIAGYVFDFSVAEEKSSSVRYIARLNYRFKPQPMRDLLKAYNVPFAETRSKPMVLLPVFENGAGATLWDEPNPWRQSWGTRDAPTGLVPLMLALGDLQDVSTVGAGEAMAGNAQRLSAIATRYGAAGAIVAHANMLADTGTGRLRATVTLLRPSDPFPVDGNTVTLVQNENERLSDMMARLVTATHDRIENLWKRRNLIFSTGTGVLAVAVPITSLKDWLAIRDQLRGIGIVKKLDIVLMSRDQVRVNVFYAGGAEQLTTALEQANLSLLQESGEWVLMPVGVLQPPRT